MSLSYPVAISDACLKVVISRNVLKYGPYMQDSEIDQTLDVRELNCPLPLLKAKQALNKLAPGQVLKVIATDVGSVRDFKAFTDQSDHELLNSFIGESEYTYLIRRG
jgi:tRNA 2-thiouridine synthesizing protein A